ncbi:neutral zinc metallopeptidase [soil metagenome]
MRWQGGREGGNVEDRRGMGGGAVAGGGVGVAILGLIGYFVFGIDPSTTQQVASSLGGAGQEQQAGQVGTPTDEAGKFVDIVGTNIDDVWKTKIDGYAPPTVVIYEQGTSTGCGHGESAMGPFYCPTDHKVYLDLAFWQEMQDQLGGSGADFAKAYVLAHEYGHHVQTYTGASDRAENASRGDQNRYSVALELQADCYAGVWAKNAASVSNGQVSVDGADLEEGLKTASAIGDDTLQRNAGQSVSPDSFTHGSSADRVSWLRRGYQSGDPASCDTFANL